ncbi:hypothetical protein [Streptomyces sp. ITFR-6]|uniref:hypothetical protein n=1 Tax=Streptomyces sp. ITFR-6 TaxID=3075197 RepID=UPI00288B0A4B|nr:hypothetical protein [Streptomyces sp. ITFR-6]WNI28643.1 hypothetical protein RLT59_07455 [Streptomyces sp. ITFR-6]
MTDNHPTTAAQYRAHVKEQEQKEAFQQRARSLATNLLALPLIAFLLMLAIGAVHGFAPAIPAIGYGTTILLVLGADALSAVAKKFRK